MYLLYITIKQNSLFRIQEIEYLIIFYIFFYIKYNSDVQKNLCNN